MFLFISFSVANSTSVEETFLQCISKTQSSVPISEAIYTPQNSSFVSVLHSYVRNLRFMTPETPKPLVIVAALDESHVQATVKCSKSLGLGMRIRSGGHDYDGLSYVSKSPFVLLDMFNLRAISINVTDESAWIQSGANLGELYYGIAQKSPVHGFPAGVCPTLGTGGHFSGGGYGNLMRKYGLSTDNIIDAKVVDANGQILDRKSMGEDLFWAIRGGGAASFCVVLSWKIKLVPVPEKVTVFKVQKTVEEGATDLVWKWENVADKLDHDLFIRVILAPVNGTKPGVKTIQASFVAMFLGNTSRLLNIMDQSFPELGLQQKDCIEMKWVESVLFWMDFPKGTPIDVLLEKAPRFSAFAKLKSDYVQKPIPKAGLVEIWKAILNSESVSMEWNPYGGRMSEIPSTATAFPHRAGNIFKIQYLATWKDPASEIGMKYLNLTEKLYDAMTPYASKNPREAFLNYRDVDIGINSKGTLEEGRTFGVKYFKENFNRLVHVKSVVDPDNFFRYEQRDRKSVV